jgi:hypothetical protein
MIISIINSMLSEFRKQHLIPHVSKQRTRLDNFNAWAIPLLESGEVSDVLSQGPACDIHHILGRYVAPALVDDPRNTASLNRANHRLVTDGILVLFTDGERWYCLDKRNQSVRDITWTVLEYQRTALRFAEKYAKYRTN